MRTVLTGIAIGAFALGGTFALGTFGCAVKRATMGAAIGGVLGRYMGEQAKELSAIEGIKTERVGDEIRLTCESATLFDFGSAMLKLESQEIIEQIAGVFVKYPDTDIAIAGHTDSAGPDDYNQKLSERQAISLRDCLVDLGVAPSRLQAVGYGELHPVGTNDTDEGRRLNRRVEIQIRSSEESKVRVQRRSGDQL